MSADGKPYTVRSDGLYERVQVTTDPSHAKDAVDWCLEHGVHLQFSGPLFEKGEPVLGPNNQVMVAFVGLRPLRPAVGPGDVLIDQDREIDAEANLKHHPEASYEGIRAHLEHILRGYRESIALGDQADNPHSEGSARHTSWALGAHWAKNDLRRAGVTLMPEVPVQTQPKTETP